MGSGGLCEANVRTLLSLLGREGDSSRDSVGVGGWMNLRLDGEDSVGGASLLRGFDLNGDWGTKLSIGRSTKTRLREVDMLWARLGGGKGEGRTVKWSRKTNSKRECHGHTRVRVV
jgi:hypothetical protein